MSKEHEAHKEHEHKEHEHKHKGNQNAIIIGVVLLLVGIIVGALVGYSMAAAGTGTGNGAGNAVDLGVLKTNVQSYINANLLSGGVTATITDVNSVGNGLYLMSFELYQDGAQVSAGTVYASKDKLYLVQAAFDLNTPIPEPETPVDAAPPKTAKPVAELYIFSYCPAGTAALDSFAKAADLLKASADVQVKFFSDMHGDHELQQNKIQECIQVVDKDKYWAYAQKFVTDIYPVCGATADVNCDATESKKLMDSLGIDSTTVMDCVATQGDALYAQEQADAIALQLQYSPSVVINDTYLGNVERSPEGLKVAICNAFITAPETCAAALADQGAAASGSCS